MKTSLKWVSSFAKMLIPWKWAGGIDRYRILHEEFLKSLNLVIGYDQLLDIVCAKLREVANSQSICLYLNEPLTGRYLCRRSRGIDRLPNRALSASDNIIKWFNVNRHHLHLDESKDILPFFAERDRSILIDINAMLLIPMVVFDRLTGIVILGRKEDATSYQDREIELLTMLCSQAGLFIEHASIHQLQEHRLKKIRHSDKLASVGELAAGVAHEIRNPLTSIRSSIQYLSNTFDGSRKDLANGIVDEVDRINRIVEGLLSFSKTSEPVLRIVDIESVLCQVITLLDSKMKQNNIELEWTPPETPLSVLADPNQLKQAFLNILMNAVEAMSAGGNLRVVAGPSNSFPGSVEVIVRDNGIGITPPDLTRVFDPFFTTKESGTGLGLSITYGIIHKHNGDIEIESSGGKEPGTTVMVRLPINVGNP